MVLPNRAPTGSLTQADYRTIIYEGLATFPIGKLGQLDTNAATV